MRTPGLAIWALTLSCVFACGSTGGRRLTFRAFAAGPSDAVAGTPYEFTTGRGFRVTLSRATLHLGAMYLNQSAPGAGATAAPCSLPGDYVAEVVGARSVDLLSGALQPFPAAGEGTVGHAVAGEVWLNGGDIDAPDDKTVVLDVAGVAADPADAEATYPFQAALTIGKNRAAPPSDPALPGSNPICRARIASPIAASLQVRDGGRLVLRIDPRGLFANVDFAQLRPVTTEPPSYAFGDGFEGQPEVNLFRALTAREGVYTFSWEVP